MNAAVATCGGANFDETGANKIYQRVAYSVPRIDRVPEFRHGSHFFSSKVLRCSIVRYPIRCSDIRSGLSTVYLRKTSTLELLEYQ